MLTQKQKLIHPVDTTRKDVNLQLFEQLFLQDFMEDVIISERKYDLEQYSLSYGELLLWIGM